MMAGAGGKGKQWNVGDILGRSKFSKQGFRPLSTDEGDNMLDEDSDSEVKFPCSHVLIIKSLIFQVEEFSIPVNHA